VRAPDGLYPQVKRNPCVRRDAAKETCMSPTVFRERGFRFFFLSREEPRVHIHVQSADGEAKFWLEPHIELAANYGLRQGKMRIIEQLIEEHRDEIQDAWKRHFGS